MDNSELSLSVAVDANFRKAILLASASYFEKRVCELITDYARSHVSDERLICFINNKALSRQYHTFFNWDAKNCNNFLGLFGDDFKREFASKISANPLLEVAIKNFIEIGGERNRMVHQDFGQYSLEKTSEEIINLHVAAKSFILELRSSLIPTKLLIME